MPLAAIALGSNIRPEEHLPRAVRRIAEIAPIVQVSTVWESPPWGFAEQPHFLNAAVLIESKLLPRTLKHELLRIEQELGRARDPSNKNGPRTIDLDIALYGAEIYDDHELQIPDPEIPLRSFLTVPLAELLPHWIHPVLGQSLSSIARAIEFPSLLTARPDVQLAPAAQSLS